ncbi:serine/threonine-protein kinase [Microlunatus soli]|uniref:non-specific serine/threonine protein kinase n=1 Tax=Microlunatus soli TaxID=630515 RepID=A0A1H1WQI5_9ACTN|nr:serine/threonine-protein kinase [Microlunatus soli]SDS99568.1 Serine/threonine protein kinase [Microlunatus soli]
MDVVGRYRVERRIGAGAFSTVWLAYDDALAIPVAIKLLSDNWVEHADVRSRFLDEARLLRRISNPGIIGVHDIGRLADGRDYFVMDYADGGTVADLCEQPVPVDTALRLGADIAHAVGRLHENGVLHRDLKPANVLLASKDGQRRPVLADLGTAKRLAEASGLTLTAGTPAYMAPEQAKGLGLDERTDVYGVAAVCYRMIVGDVPYPGESVTEIANRPPDRHPAVSLDDRGLPAGVAALLIDGLATDPDRRPESADALAARLDALTAPASDPAGGPGPQRRTDQERRADPDRPYRPTELRHAGSTDPRAAETVPSRDSGAVVAGGARALAPRATAAGAVALVIAVATWLALSLLLGR